MGYGRQTVERRQLGLVLKRLRSKARKSQQEAAQAIGRTAGRISQVETAKGSLSIEELTTLLDFYGADEDERKTTLALGTETRRRQRRRAYTDLLPESFQRLADLQADAQEINYYESGHIPGLVQSRDYVLAMIRAGDGVWWDASEDEVESRSAFRLEQQRRVLEANEPKKLKFVFTEDALHNVVGNPSVMQGQVIHLLQLIESRPNLSVQVVPTGTADNPAPGGGLIVLDFAAAPRIGFVSVLYGPYTYHDQTEDTELMSRVFQRVRELALSPEESRALLIKKLKES